MADRTQFELLEHLSDATRQAIEYYSMRFESAWQGGKRPRIEGYLDAFKDADGRPGLLAELLRVELACRQRLGEQPRAQEYLQRFPALATVVQQLFGLEQPLDPTIIPDPMQNTPPLTDATLTQPPPPRAQPAADATQANPVLPPVRDATAAGGSPRATLVMPELPGYEMVSVLGRGGMGIVYLARQRGANRQVALKMLLSGDYDNEAMLARFLVEGEMLARLQHPNIVQIYEVGTHQDRPFLALEYVGGGTLADRLNGERMLARDAARLVEQLARAVNHAHQQGVIHRDLKPGNILLEGAPGQDPSTCVPKITDFGLARQVEGDLRLTQTGAVMGTPSYMSPEQARGDRQVGPPTDIFALGCILYELLTGRTPFRGETNMETLLNVVNNEAPPPRRLQARVPLDLDVICLKCLEKDPRRRYAAAEQLAEDLRRFLHGEPISARAVAWPERLWKWAQRKPALAALSGALAVILLGSFLVITSAWRSAVAGWTEADTQRQQVDQQRRQAESRRQDAEKAQQLADMRRQDAEKARQQAETARQQADAARRRAEQAGYFSAIARARLEWELNNAEGARTTLDACPPALRGWEWNYLNGLHQADRWTTVGNPPYVFDLAFRPDGKVVGSVGGGNPFFGSQGVQSIRPGDARLWDARTGQPFAVVSGHANIVTALAFSRDGSLLATASCDGLVNLADLASGKRRFSLGEPRTVGFYHRHALAFSPDGGKLAALLANQVAFWDTASGKKLLELPPLDKDPTQALHFSTDGQTLSTLHQSTLRQWDAASGKPLKTVPVGGSRGSSFSRDGKLAALTAGSTIKIVETATGQLQQVLSGHAGTVLATQFSPDDDRLASGASDRTVRVWSVASGQQQVVYRGHRGRVSSVAFSPDGQSLASGDEQPGEVKLWDLTTHPETVICSQSPATQAIGFTADARRLIAVARPAIRVYDAATGRREAEHPFQAPGDIVPAQAADLSADGRLLACLGPDLDAVQLWELQGDDLRPRLLRSLERQRGKIYRVALSGDGRRVAAMLLDPAQPKQAVEVKVWNATGELLTTIRPPGGLPVGFYAGLGFSRDGQRLAFDDYARGGLAVVVDLASGKQLTTLRDPQDVAAVALSADGRLLATTGHDGQVAVWDVAAGQPALPRRLSGTGKSLFDLSFSPDGRLLAGVSREEVTVWELTTGQDVLVLRGAPPRGGDNAFNPRVAWSRDGSRLAAINHNATISIWSGEAGPR